MDAKTAPLSQRPATSPKQAPVESEQLFLSLDTWDARRIDDALSLTRTADGGWRVRVALADSPAGLMCGRPREAWVIEQHFTSGIRLRGFGLRQQEVSVARNYAFEDARAILLDERHPHHVWMRNALEFARGLSMSYGEGLAPKVGSPQSIIGIVNGVTNRFGRLYLRTHEITLAGEGHFTSPMRIHADRQNLLAWADAWKKNHQGQFLSHTTRRAWDAYQNLDVDSAETEDDLSQNPRPRPMAA